MKDPLVASYESVAYDGRAIRLADPDPMAAIATLHGMTPPPPDGSRVLELGCATGWNLASMAFRLPNSTFVGVDFVPSQIETGRYIASELGLQNIELQARSIADISEADGVFDYIICHGVYSWVPAEVQDAILRVCERNLSPNGIAYISYNTYPGWHGRGMLRDMLMFHDDPSLDPEQRVARAREFARLIATADPSSDSPHTVTLRDEAKRLAKQTDQHLFHEQLEPWNEPLYFSEFMRRASGHRLGFVAEAETVLEPGAMVQLQGIPGVDGDPIRMEQYMDFARGRTFRKTLLCHANAARSYDAVPSAVRRLSMRARVVSAPPSPEDAARGPGVASFQMREGRKITTNNPLVNSTLNALVSAAPAVVSFDALVRRVSEMLGEPVDADALIETVLMCAQGGFLEFRVLPSRVAITPGVRPKASAMARWQAIHSDEVTTLGHWPHPLIGMARFLIVHLDGTKDRAHLVRLTEHAFASGELQLPGFTPTRESVLGVVEEVLEHLGRSALLVA